MKRFKTKADEPREGTLRLQPGPNPRWVARESPTDLLRKWLQDVHSPLKLRQALKIDYDWDLDFAHSEGASWSIEASSTARARAVMIGNSHFGAAPNVRLPGIEKTLDESIGILVHGTDSKSALDILESGRLKNGTSEPIGVYGCPMEKPSLMHVNYGAKIFYQVCAFPLSKNAANKAWPGPYPPGTIAHNPYGRSADEWICDGSSTKIIRIIIDFRTAWLKLDTWDATKQTTMPVPQEAFDAFCPERAEPSSSAPSMPEVKAKAKARGSVAFAIEGHRT